MFDEILKEAMVCESTKLKINKKNKKFYNYIKELGIAKTDDNLLVLSSTHSFYYDQDEMNDFKIIVNLKHLNYIKDLKEFIESLFLMIPKGTSFCGSFINNKSSMSIKNPYRYIKFITDLVSITEPRINRLLSNKDVIKLLNRYNFEVVNMEEVKGVTYFYSKKL